MLSLDKAQGPSGWTMCCLPGQSPPWIDVPSMAGAYTTVCTLKMRGWCAKVGGEGEEGKKETHFKTPLPASSSTCTCILNYARTSLKRANVCMQEHHVYGLGCIHRLEVIWILLKCHKFHTHTCVHVHVYML